jgi:hypothetical protein
MNSIPAKIIADTKRREALFVFPRSDDKEKAHQRLISDGLLYFVQQITEW